jgi:SAM-dependent methyltransferase
MMSQLKQLVRGVTDHPYRHVLQNSLLRVPGSRVLQKRVTTTGAMNKAETMHGWARQVVDAAQSAGVEVRGARMTEVGPGHSLGVAVALLMAGVSEIAAVDVKRFADPSDPEPVRPVAEYCKSQGMTTTEPLPEMLKKIRYAIVSDDGKWPVADASMDVVYSYFSGEHLRAPREVLTETSRVLRPGGVVIHAIDLRDHLHKTGNWLQMYYYNQGLWDAMTSRRGHWTNRLLPPQWRKLFEEQFEVLTFHEGRKPAPAGFDPSRVAKDFKQYTPEQMQVDYLWVVGRKPATAGAGRSVAA